MFAFFYVHVFNNFINKLTSLIEGWCLVFSKTTKNVNISINAFDALKNW